MEKGTRLRTVRASFPKTEASFFSLACKPPKHRVRGQFKRREKYLMPKTLICIALLLVLSLNLLGQVESGTVVGTVTDQGGAVVPGALVTIVNEGTRLTRAVTTSGNGQYVVDSFPT